MNKYIKTKQQISSQILKSIARGFFLFVSISFCEIVLRLNSSLPITASQIPVFALIFSIGFGISFFCNLFKPKLGFFFIILSLIISTLAYAIQICYFGVFNTFSTFGALLNGTQALTDFFSIVKSSIIANYTYLLLLLIPFVLLILFYFLKRIYKRIKHPAFVRYCFSFSKIIVSLIGCFIFRLLFLFTIFITAGIYNSPFMTYTQKRPVNDTVRSLGVLPAYEVDIQRLVWGENQFIDARILTYFNSNFNDSKNTDNSSIFGQLTQFITPPEEEIYNVLPIDFSELINDDADETIHQMDSYFASIQPDEKNEHTGIFKGKNLIYFTAESFSPYAVNKEITPTLYKLVHEGYYFSNFYTPYWEISTTDGEYVNCLGIIPKSGTFSFKNSAKNWLMFALGNQFKKLGYTTKAYHNYIGSYYYRELSHPNMGYDFISMGNGYRETKQWPDSDLVMMQETMKDYIDSPQFHAYYMTISGHLPYNFWANSMAIQNYDLVKDLPYEELIQAFYACNIELDRAFEYTIKTLEEKGIAENTVIVLAADHYPYGLKQKQFNELAGHEIDLVFELYKNNLILFNPAQKPETVDKLSSNIDILPTISNLFGLPYDSRLLMGHDIFSKTEPFIIFESSKVITDKLNYRGDIDKATSENGEEITQEEIDNVKKTLSDKVKYSALILDKDYYRRIQNYLDKKEEQSDIVK